MLFGLICQLFEFILFLDPLRKFRLKIREILKMGSLYATFGYTGPY